MGGCLSCDLHLNQSKQRPLQGRVFLLPDWTWVTGCMELPMRCQHLTFGCFFSAQRFD